MKKLYASLAVLVLTLSVGITVMAGDKPAKKGAAKAGCSSCDKKSCPTPEQMKKFKLESIDLRQEMMTKRFDLQRENLKETPDSARVTAIKADMEAIKTKIDALKTANKIPVTAGCCKEDCPLMECGPDKGGMGGHCDKKGQKAGCSCKADCSCPDCKNGAGDKAKKKSGCGCDKKGKDAGK